MIPNFTHSAPSPFPPVDPSEDHDPRDHHHHFFLPNYQTPASSSSVSYSVFFGPPPHDQPEYCHVEVHQEKPPQEDANHHALYTGSHDPAHEKKPNNGLKISLWKNNESDHHGDQENPVKWMFTKMRLMQKMKKSDTTTKQEDHPKQPASSPLETDHFSSSNSSSNNSNATPFRVCADCNTTRTPLWRSGPKGPKSLCNACGIRQRKARRAMAAAAAAATYGTGQHYETKSTVKIKLHNKEKVKNNGQTTQFKKRSKAITAGSSQSPHAQQKNNVFEDFLFNLSKKLAFYRVFPQDEKEAAILLMALSCGLVHG